MPPFATQNQEAEAIDAKLFVLRREVTYALDGKKYVRVAARRKQIRLVALIADGKKAAAQLRVG